MKTHFLLAALLGGVTFLAACGGGGGGDTAQLAASDAVVNVGAANGRTTFRALQNEAFVFPNGVAAFGTTSATTVAVTPPAAAGASSGFTVTNGGQTASGVMQFGSCDFRITSSTFAGSVMVVGETIEVTNCSLRIDTSGQAGDGVAVDVLVFLILNTSTSNGTLMSVSIDGNGRVFVNGQLVGTVTLGAVTGA
jgi:hypothetical protein